MSRLRVVRVLIARDFESHTFFDAFGLPESVVFSCVAVAVEDGRHFVLPAGREVTDGERVVGVEQRYQPERMVRRVRNAGSIDPDLWVEVLDDEIASEMGRCARLPACADA